MNGIDSAFLDKHRKFRVDSKKLATVFFVLAFIVAIIVFWWLKLIGITATGEAFCGVDEHSHSYECYTNELICSFEEVIQTTAENVTVVPETTQEATEENTEENTEETIEEITEEITEAVTQSQHIHTDECYEKKLICEKTEHIHTAECFPDKEADVETVSDWLATLEKVEITNNIPENIVNIALSQVGYEESAVNFETDAGGNKNGYTRYGELYGNPYGDWNTMFVSFCLHYANINNVDVLKSAGAESMRLAWEKKYAYADADSYVPQRGDLVFFDSDSDGTADSTGIIVFAGTDVLQIVLGDSNNKVENIHIDVSDDILGYGLSGELHFAKDTEYAAREESTLTEIQTEEETTYRPLMLMSAAPADTTGDETQPNIHYRTDLSMFLTSVEIKTQDGVEITDGSTVYLGQTYSIIMEFKEDNEGDEWYQFGHNDEHFLTYQIPSNFHCEPFTEWHSITAKTENGTVEDVGKYFIDANGYLLVTFNDGPDGLCFGHRYSNVDFNIEFNASVGASLTDDPTDVKFNDEISININIDGGAGVSVSKSHGSYDRDAHTMEYTVKVLATYGMVSDFTLEDYTWHSHTILRDTIVVTDLDGIPLDPQPTVGDQFTQGVYNGFSLTGFPDFPAGDGYLITYKSKIDDNLLENDSVSLGNGVYGEGKGADGEPAGSYQEHWATVDLQKLGKNGKQTVIKDNNGNSIYVIEWQVVIKRDTEDMQGSVVIDTLGDGLQYYTDIPVVIKCYDEFGNYTTDVELDWNNITLNGNSMTFNLPSGYMFNIFYYTSYIAPEEGETKNYTNSVKVKIDEVWENAGGEVDVVTFVPRIAKSASGNDGKYVYFSIDADVPAIIRNNGNFYLSDLSSLWHSGIEGSYCYVENLPEDMVITATTLSGDIVTFTPYVAGGPVENTYILVAPAEGDLRHSFNVYFNTSSPDKASSTWLLSEDAVLTITYKLPFDSTTGVEWEGELSGEKTLEELLLEGYTLTNTAKLNYSPVIRVENSATYKYSPAIIKKSQLNVDGTIEYTVLFHNTIPGSGGDSGYLSGSKEIFFTDSFDEKLEYVQGSLTVACYDPWDSGRRLTLYRYNGTVDGNSMNIASTDLLLESVNTSVPAIWAPSWLNSLSNYQKYCNNMGGGDHIFTYKLKLKDEYLYSTEENVFELDNTAEVKWDTDGSSGPATDTVEYKTGLLDKVVIQENNKLDFDIHINRNALDILPGSATITIEDTMTHNLSLYWDTIKLFYEDEDGSWIDFDAAESDYEYTVTYDQNSNRLTFILPDELHMRIDYTTLVTESGLISVNNAVRIEGKALVTDIVDAVFKVEQHSGGASGSIHNITLLKQDGNTDVPLPGVTFRFYGPMGNPEAVLPSGVPKNIVTDNNKTLQYIGSYTTGADGTVKIETQYLTIGGPYALVEAEAPAGYNKLTKPVYFYFYSTDPNGIIQTVTTLIAVENYPYGFVLPETGGSGTYFVTIIGSVMMAAPVLYSIIRLKRERRRKTSNLL